MKFLTFSDTHEDFDSLKKLSLRAKEDDIEFVLVAGDFTNFERNIRPMLKELNKIGKTIYIIPGNHEEGEVYGKVIGDYPNCVNVDRKATKLGNYLLLGYGGGGFSQSDPEFRSISRTWYGHYKSENIILMLHGPPFGTKLDLLNNQYVGNKDYRRFVDRVKPKLVICGHIHENMGVIDEIEETKLVNPCWEGMVIELP
jgi:uncharacterized protein